MIDPTENDIGRTVVYHPTPDAEREVGKIIKFNSTLVFVHFTATDVSRGCKREDLSWQEGQ